MLKFELENMSTANLHGNRGSPPAFPSDSRKGVEQLEVILSKFVVS